MKAIFMYFLVLIVCATMFIGCSFQQVSITPTQAVSNQKESPSKNIYQILEISFTDSIPGASHSVEYGFWNEKDVAEPNEKVVTHSIGGVIVIGEYTSSSRKKPNNYASYTYIDSGVGSFEVDENGKITSFSLVGCEKDILEPDWETIDQDECQEIAIEFLQRYVNIDEYRIEAEYHEKSKEYEFSFTKYIGGHRTADQARIYVTNTGEICSFYSYMLGRIPNNTEVDFDYQKVETEIFTKLNGIYADTKQYCTDIKYETIGYETTILENGEVALLCYVDVTCVYDVYEYQAGITERVGFVIMKNASSNNSAST